MLANNYGKLILKLPLLRASNNDTAAQQVPGTAVAVAVAHRALADAEQGRPAADHAAGRLVDDYGTNPTHEQYENRRRCHGDPRRTSPTQCDRRLPAIVDYFHLDTVIG